MQKYVIVVYDVYDLQAVSDVIKTQKWEKVPFCEENTEYDDSVDYKENVCNFISDCMNSQVVFLGDKYIPLHNIHGFYFDKENKQDNFPLVKVNGITELKPIQGPNNQNNQNNHPNNNQNRRHGRFKKIKHRHGRPQSNTAANLPFNVQKGEPIVSTTSAPILPSTPQLPECEVKI